MYRDWSQWDPWAEDVSPRSRLQISVKNTFIHCGPPAPQTLQRSRTAPAATRVATSFENEQDTHSEESSQESQVEECAQTEEDTLRSHSQELEGMSEWEWALDVSDRGPLGAPWAGPEVPPGVLLAREAPTVNDASQPPGVFHDEAAIEAALAATDIEVVDTVNRCSSVCEELLRQTEIAVDLEGEELSRHGPLCILQVAVRDGRVFLFDVIQLGREGFDQGLRQLLESDQVSKLFFDCRCDADALYYQFELQLRNVLDMQVLREKSIDGGMGNWLHGFKKVLEELLPVDEFKRCAAIKTIGRKLYEPDLGGSFEVWKARPLHPALKTYCAVDVGHLFKMLDTWGVCLPRHTLRQVSERRAHTQIAAPIFVKGPHRAQKDFVIQSETDSGTHPLNTLSGWANPQVGLPQEQQRISAPPPMKELSRSISISSGAQRISWSLESSLLRSSNKHKVSPTFELDVNGSAIEFKLLLNAASSKGGRRGEGSFKGTKGRGTIALKCVGDPSGSSLRFRFFVGEQPKRGPVEHDFEADGASATLPATEAVWDLASSVAEERIVLGVEVIQVMPQFQ